MILSILFATAAVIHAAMLVWTLRLKAGVPERLVQLLLLGLMTDNMILALGPIAWDASWYETLSKFRYVAHVFVLPPLVVAAVGLAARAGVEWGASNLARWTAILFALSAIAFGFSTEIVGLELQPETLYGHTRLVSVHASPPLATIMTNVALLVIAAIIWRRSGWPWAFAGSLMIFVVNGASAGSDWGIVAGNIAEVGFAASWVATLFRFPAD